MAQHNTDGTGSLMLVRRTPIINAFFGAMLGEEPPVTGAVREDVLRQSTENIEPPTWDSIREALIDIVRNNLKDPTQSSLADCLRALMGRFQRTDQWLIDLLPVCEGEDDSTADFALCFDLAAAFDDGHGLVSLSMEVAYTCSKLLAGEFGGSGEYVTKNVCCYGGSSSPIIRGQQIQAAILADDAGALEKILCESVDTLLDEIRIESVRNVMRQKVMAHLSTPR